jgi:cytidine deaminase
LDAFENLVHAAREAREHALAPYSAFRVGAAIACADGRVFTGCNVESASFGLTVCAERVAIWKALSEGARSFTAIAVVAESASPTPPCGACRQVLWEHCGDVPVVLADLRRIAGAHRLSALFPLPFDARLVPPGP